MAVRCKCLGLKHKCYSNCIRCGFIFCIEDEAYVGISGCYMCGNIEPIIPPYSHIDIRGQTNLGMNQESTLRAYALKDKLLQFDMENAKRTHVHDAQADYYETKVWLTKEEKAAIDEKQRVRREALQPSHRKAYLSVNIKGGGRVTAQTSFKRDLEDVQLGEGDQGDMASKCIDDDARGDAGVAQHASLASNPNHVGAVYRKLLV